MYSENENNPSLRKVSKKQKFNVGKTENIFVYPRTVRIKPKDIQIEVGGENIKSSPSVRNLGLVLDANFTLENHVKCICMRAQFHNHSIIQGNTTIVIQQHA